MCAPSRLNRQPWHFVVIRDKDLQRNICDTCQGRPFYVEQAPVLIALCANPAESPTWMMDISAAAENLLLAATAMGLGGAWFGSPDTTFWLELEALLKDALGVPEQILREHGAVSEPVVVAMAEGARERFGADLAVSTTGIAGPGGGSDEKPVGLVWVGFSDGGETAAQDFEFPLDRSRHRRATAQVALDWVRRALLGEERVALRYLRRSR